MGLALLSRQYALQLFDHIHSARIMQLLFCQHKIFVLVTYTEFALLASQCIMNKCRKPIFTLWNMRAARVHSSDFQTCNAISFATSTPPLHVIRIVAHRKYAVCSQWHVQAMGEKEKLNCEPLLLHLSA